MFETSREDLSVPPISGRISTSFLPPFSSAPALPTAFLMLERTEGRAIFFFFVSGVVDDMVEQIANTPNIIRRDLDFGFKVCVCHNSTVWYSH